ncbi:hypothetical protein UFOVP1305_81 [uncultured Caudovirales phage]|uniref:Uncharacterized protein n=1 Tax=uncultured Caudovirales phage TaxID=2100421 RepID=A0A6J5RVQ7_9CAUD|nr:hypothetical protein UFOVP896_26 [uncultured Caudovirales phage]CAB4198397.1 hypothetical protein UFOVP1305_81 [uncultured Caudovirales phage]
MKTVYEVTAEKFVASVLRKADERGIARSIPLFTIRMMSVNETIHITARAVYLRTLAENA